MVEIIAVLGLPLVGALALALVGERRVAPLINVGASLLTWLASIALTARVIIIRKESMTLAMAMPSVARVTVFASWAMG